MSWPDHVQDTALWLDAWLAWRGDVTRTLVAWVEETPRGWPLLDTVATRVGVHAAGSSSGDLCRAPGARPALRVRLVLPQDAGEVNDVLTRADLRVLVVGCPGNFLTAAMNLSGWSQLTGDVILWGREEEGGWQTCAPLILRRSLRPLPAPPGWRCLASAGIRERLLSEWPGVSALLKTACPALARRGLGLEQVPGPGHVWRLSVDAVQTWVAFSEMQRQRTEVWGRAMADPRGNFSLLRAWNGPITWRARLRRLPVCLSSVSLILAGGEGLSAMARESPQGLLLRAHLPALSPGQSAVLHGVLPAYSLPREDCAEFITVAWEFPA